ncbi:MAG: rhomboid family intramembrane serine protease [Bacteroidaceae bacterium]|nr:rhomboid family intramembrane serine protease [Bacteroidaceae bacterium]
MDRIPVVTKNLLAINGIMFLALLVAQKNGIDLNNLLGLHFFMSEEFHPYQLVTYMFMHGGFTHLFFNMFALFMFGRTLEYVWGPKRFLIFYMLAGVGAGLVQEAVGAVRYFSLVDGMDAESIGVVLREGAAALHEGKNFVLPKLAELNLVLNSQTVGASGAVYAILLGFGMLFPNERMFIFPLPFPIKAKFFVIGYALIELYMGVAGTPDGIAHFAHLGGMLFGLALILLWRKKGEIGGPYV